MKKIICPRCGAENSSEMAFCTNCGQPFAAPNGKQPNAVAPSVLPSQMPTATMPAAQAKNNRGLIFGLLGCGGLIAIFLVAIVVISVFIKLGESSQVNTNLSNTNSIFSNTKNLSNSNSGISSSNSNSIVQLNSSTLDEMRSLKQVGPFRQTDVKDIPAADAYPSASEAVQVAYQNGKQSATSIVAQFPSNEAALADFEKRVSSIKDGGGKFYNNLNKNGTQGVAYKYNEYYYIEVCGEAVCWRNYSSELNAVRTFAVNFPNGSAKTKK